MKYKFDDTLYLIKVYKQLKRTEDYCLLFTYVYVNSSSLEIY